MFAGERKTFFNEKKPANAHIRIVLHKSSTRETFLPGAVAVACERPKPNRNEIIWPKLKYFNFGRIKSGQRILFAMQSGDVEEESEVPVEKDVKKQDLPADDKRWASRA